MKRRVLAMLIVLAQLLTISVAAAESADANVVSASVDEVVKLATDAGDTGLTIANGLQGDDLLPDEGSGNDQGNDDAPESPVSESEGFKYAIVLENGAELFGSDGNALGFLPAKAVVLIVINDEAGMTIAYNDGSVIVESEADPKAFALLTDDEVAAYLDLAAQNEVVLYQGDMNYPLIAVASEEEAEDLDDDTPNVVDGQDDGSGLPDPDPEETPDGDDVVSESPEEEEKPFEIKDAELTEDGIEAEELDGEEPEVHTRIVSGWGTFNGHKYYYDANGKFVTGFQKIGSSRYYFHHESGIMQTGWVEVKNDPTSRTEKGTWYYFESNGKMAVNKTLTIDGKTYIFGSNGKLASGQWVYDTNKGNWRYTNADGSTPADGIQLIGNDWFYLKNGYRQYDWQMINDEWYFFARRGSVETESANPNTGSGIMAKRWVAMPKSTDPSVIMWYYLDENDGHMLTGMQVISGKVFYFTEGGVMAHDSSIDIGGVRYFFGPDGNLLRGTWKSDSRGVWYVGSNGTSVNKNCWQQIDGYWYHFNGSGYADSGWIIETIDGKTVRSYTNPDSEHHERLQGWQKIPSNSSNYYYFNKDGHMMTGFQKIGAADYYLTESGDNIGRMITNAWATVGSNKYYFKANGAMAINQHLITADGVWRSFDTKGLVELTGGWKSDSTGKWYAYADGIVPKKAWFEYNNNKYYFNESGYAVTGIVTIDGVKHKFDENGVWQGVYNPTDPVTIDGVVYDVSGTTAVVTGYTGSSAAVTVQQTVEGKTVTKIGNSAFENKTTIKSIDLPDTIQVIGTRAFAGCIRLTTMS